MSRREYFGTDGIRGRVGSPVMNAEFMMKLGCAAGRVLTKDSKAATVLIGHDTRESCDMLESALQCGLSAAGVSVKLVGTLPTPGIAYLTRSMQATAGIVISASHNPYDDNGVKFFDASGFKLSDERELAIELEIKNQKGPLVSQALGRVHRVLDASTRYIEFCKRVLIDSATEGDIFQDLSGLRIVLDCANGATYRVAPKIFQELGADVVTIHNVPNGKNINQQCGATQVASLQAAVKKHKADIGLAFDGDGDRLVLVDGNGEAVDGDEILCILALGQENTLKSQHEGVVGTVMSNLGLEQAMQKHGLSFERTAVGDRYVLDCLRQKNWSLGGESSGHIVNLRYTTTGDGIMTGLQILKIMRETGRPLAQLKKAMTKRPQVLINVPIKQKFDFESNTAVQTVLKEAENELQSTGRVLLRPSGTEPLIRVMVEGNNAQQVHAVAERIAEVVAAEAIHQRDSYVD